MRSWIVFALAIALHGSAIASIGPKKPEKPKQEQKPPFFEQGLSLSDDNVQHNDIYPSGYNAPACIKVDHSWDLNANVSFIYWYMEQDAMDLGFVTPIPGTTPGTTTAGATLNQNFGYNPGFQVGLGMDMGTDGWVMNADYTWYHSSESQAPVSAPDGGTWNTSNFMSQSDTGTSIGSSWKMHMDLLDVVGGRPVYRGRSLTVSSSYGLRALWIRQNEAITILFPGFPNDIVFAGSKSWALGFVGKTNAHMILWKGLRLDGVMGASLLYTEYSKITNDITFLGNSVASSVKNKSTLRPTFDAGLGLGYGAYCFKNQFYFDLSARYDFNLFWAQNVMRNFASQLLGSDNEIGNLVLHGLTLNLRCDF